MNFRFEISAFGLDLSLKTCNLKYEISNLKLIYEQSTNIG
jgi:hypothetical protein